MTYEQLDFIADLYIPLLIIVTCFVIIKIGIARGIKYSARQCCIILLSLIVIYGIMLTDNALGICPRLGWDYSTHTALALVFVIYISFLNRIASKISWSSLIAYICLMIYQKYHTPIDIVTTLIAVSPALIWLNVKNKKQQ